MPELKSKQVKGDKFFFSLSFDIDDFVGDGIWWLQIYDSDRNRLYDKPFASSRDKLDTSIVENIIREEFLSSG